MKNGTGLSIALARARDCFKHPTDCADVELPLPLPRVARGHTPPAFAGEGHQSVAPTVAEAQSATGGRFASNTSTLPIARPAQASLDAAKFVGIPFFSPMDKMKLVQIIRGEQADDNTIARDLRWATRSMRRCASTNRCTERGAHSSS